VFRKAEAMAITYFVVLHSSLKTLVQQLTKTSRAGLKTTINDEGVWRIRRASKSHTIEVFRVEETGHGNILPDDFINWRIKLSLQNTTNT